MTLLGTRAEPPAAARPVRQTPGLREDPVHSENRIHRFQSQGLTVKKSKVHFQNIKESILWALVFEADCGGLKANTPHADERPIRPWPGFP